MTAHLTFDYEVSREYDGGEYGDVLGFNVKGHIDHLDVDLFLAHEVDEWLEEWQSHDFDVTHCWVRKVPRSDGMLYQYQGHPGPGATAVTLIEKAWSWGRWCVHHPFEPASTGIPVYRIVDGERIVAEHLAAMADRIDPCPDVDSFNGGCVYMCRDCAKSFSARYDSAYRTALADQVTA